MKGHDPFQLDLFTRADGEGSAQIATQAAGKQSLPAPAPASPSLLTDAGHRPCRDETTVLRFPVERWAPRLWLVKVDKIARQLRERKTERGRSNLWRSAIETLFSQMRRRGATGSEIDRQIADFHAAVSWALSDQQSGPGAA